MTIQHKDLPEDGLHELKGASTAIAGTVAVSDGAGSSTWQVAKIAGQDLASAGSSPVSDGLGGASWQAPGGSLFGDMDFSLNTIATNITTASPTPGDGNAVILTGANLVTPGPLYAQGVVDTIGFENTGNNELLRVTQDGIYEVSFNASFSGGGGGAGAVYRFNFATNGVENTQHAYALRQTASSDIGNVNFSEYVQLAASDTIQATVANQTGIQDPTIEVSSLTMILVKPL
ncbi:hypothetical protein N9924_00770 [bacterium]|nr:hypothetical protein [bacterium]